jgi:aminomethyltransferase
MKKTPLYEFHLENNAVIKPYGDVLTASKYHEFEQEYWAIRKNIAMIDMSGIAKIKVSGGSATEWLDYICTGNIFSLSEGKSVYTAVCKEDGTMVALICVLKDNDEYLILTDAEKKVELVDWFNKNKHNDVSVFDISEEYGCISVVGPKAIEIPKMVISEDILSLPYLGFEHDKINDVDCILYRFGLTGEYEYRFLIPKEKTLELWNKIIDIGKELGLVCCGLDSLEIPMLEMNSINQQKDIIPDATVLQLQLNWMVDFYKEKFVGKEAILKEKSEGLVHKLVMFVTEEGGVKEKDKIYIEDEEIGFVVHHGYSPQLKVFVGLAYVKTEYAYSGISLGLQTMSNPNAVIEIVSAPLFLTDTVKGVKI